MTFKNSNSSQTQQETSAWGGKSKDVYSVYLVQCSQERKEKEMTFSVQYHMEKVQLPQTPIKTHFIFYYYYFYLKRTTENPERDSMSTHLIARYMGRMANRGKVCTLIMMVMNAMYSSTLIKPADWK